MHGLPDGAHELISQSQGCLEQCYRLAGCACERKGAPLNKQVHSGLGNTAVDQPTGERVHDVKKMSGGLHIDVNLLHLTLFAFVFHLGFDNNKSLH